MELNIIKRLLVECCYIHQIHHMAKSINRVCIEFNFTTELLMIQSMFNFLLFLLFLFHFMKSFIHMIHISSMRCYRFLIFIIQIKLLLFIELQLVNLLSSACAWQKSSLNFDLSLSYRKIDWRFLSILSDSILLSFYIN